jgi:hypothetical protein
MRLVGIGLAAALLAAAGLGSAAAQTMSYSQAGALIAQSCGKDIEKFCPKANLGGGDIKDCMQAQKAKINPQCLQDYQAVVASLAKRNAAQLSVPKLCRNDVARRCQGMVAGDAHFLSCLNAAKRVVSAGCTQALTDAGWN